MLSKKVRRIRQRLTEELPGHSREGIDMYTLLALLKGERVTHDDIYHVWGARCDWRIRRDTNFRLISCEARRAIILVAGEMKEDGR